MQVFMNSRPAVAEGSHRSPYATLYKACLSASRTPASEILQGKVQSKATDPLQGQHENGASAGEEVSKLRVKMDFGNALYLQGFFKRSSAGLLPIPLTDFR